MRSEIKYKYILLALIILFLANVLEYGVQGQMKIVFSIVLFAAVLWFTEAMPLHISGLLAVFLLAVFGGFKPEFLFTPFFDPIVVLLLGGFVLSIGMQKHKLDFFIAHKILNRVGNSPWKILFAFMALTAFLSFWMTNTATTLLILPIAVSVLAKNKLNPLKSKYGKALVLGVAFSATIGGLGTIIGTTPNAIAVKFLADSGITVSFLEWMYFGVPITVVLLTISFLVLIKFFKPEIKKIKIEKVQSKISKNQKLVFFVLAATIFLWTTTSFHTISAPVISLVPIILLYLFKLLGGKDLSLIDWGALLLFGSGLSLGSAINGSGLDKLMADQLVNIIQGQPTILAIFVLVWVAIAITAATSNTATAAILIPVLIPFSSAVGIDLKFLLIFMAMAISIDFIVPIGTPPNTIAYYSGYVRIKDMVKAGLVITFVASIVLSLFFMLFV